MGIINLQKHLTCAALFTIQLTTKIFIIVFLGATVSEVAIASPVTLIPTGLTPGDTYHLVFVSSTTRNALSANIFDYDSHIQKAANAAGIGMGSVIGDVDWLAIASTPTVHAGNHINVTSPVFRLDGSKVADTPGDLYNFSIDNPISINEKGDQQIGLVWTGTQGDGVGVKFYTLGEDPFLALVGRSWHDDVQWIHGGFFDNQNSYSVYGISEELRVPNVAAVPEPTTFLLFMSGLVGLLGYAWKHLKGKTR